MVYKMAEGFFKEDLQKERVADGCRRQRTGALNWPRVGKVSVGIVADTIAGELQSGSRLDYRLEY